MAEIRSFRDLNVYKRAREGAREIYEISKTFPRDERYSLTDQIRRSSRAVNAMLAEAWAKRRYEPAFVSKVNDALGELLTPIEQRDVDVTRAQIEAALASARFEELDTKWQQIGAMLNKMTERAHDFCKSQSAVKLPPFSILNPLSSLTTIRAVVTMANRNSASALPLPPRLASLRARSASDPLPSRR
mgnify:CR=1 FL=1